MNIINENYEIPEQTIEQITENYINNLQAAQELGQEFMYQTLMDYGNQLGEYPEENKTEENKIHGCQSTVYISAEKIDARIFYKGFADSKLVQGQVAILLKILDGQKADDIINNSKKCLDEFARSTNIIASLTPSRQNAFGSMYEHMRKLASDL
ncbi:SufE family protein [Bacteroidota bacterium]